MYSHRTVQELKEAGTNVRLIDGKRLRFGEIKWPSELRKNYTQRNTGRERQ